LKLIEVRDLRFRYGEGGFELLIDELTVEEGEVVTLLGPNGSGKTTLLLCVEGILKPEKGSMLVAGKNPFKLRRNEVAKLIGFVPREHHPTFPFTVLDFVVMGRAAYIGLFGSPSRRDLEIALKALESVGISHLADRPYTQISGGERQLALVARALAQEPKVLLLDEPTAHLDFRNQVSVLTVIRELTRRKGLASLVTLHDPNLAAAFSDKIALMSAGRILDFGSPDEVVTPEKLEKAYGIPVKVVNADGVRLVTPKPVKGGWT